VRLRSLASLTTGAALGAGAMYLFDPELGPERRRQARRTAVREAARATVDLGRRAVTGTAAVADAAVQGYAEGRR
jgi:gas vesicle protein